MYLSILSQCLVTAALFGYYQLKYDPFTNAIHGHFLKTRRQTEEQCDRDLV